MRCTQNKHLNAQEKRNRKKSLLTGGARGYNQGSKSSLYLGVRAHYRGGLAAPVPLESNLWQKTAWVVRKPGLGMILHGNNVMEVVESYSIVSDNQVAKNE